MLTVKWASVVFYGSRPDMTLAVCFDESVLPMPMCGQYNMKFDLRGHRSLKDELRRLQKDVHIKKREKYSQTFTDESIDKIYEMILSNEKVKDAVKRYVSCERHGLNMLEEDYKLHDNSTTYECETDQSI